MWVECKKKRWKGLKILVCTSLRMRRGMTQLRHRQLSELIRQTKKELEKKCASANNFLYTALHQPLTHQRKPNITTPKPTPNAQRNGVQQTQNLWTNTIPVRIMIRGVESLTQAYKKARFRLPKPMGKSILYRTVTSEARLKLPWTRFTA